MSIAPPIDNALPAEIPPEPVFRLTVSQYHEMIATGILGDDDQVELVEGWLIPKVVTNPPHSTSRHLVAKALEQIIPAGWHVRSQEPITLSDSEPEPDVAVVRGNPMRYERSHPRPQDIAIVVEVADASLGRDRSMKKRVYARAAIPEYWIVNLLDRSIEVYREPATASQLADYARCEQYHTGMDVPLIIDGRPIGHVSVAAILPAGRTTGLAIFWR